MLLDTSFLLDVMKSDADALAKDDELNEQGVPQQLSAMTLYELYWGVGYVDTPRDEKNKIDAVIGSKEIYPMTPNIGRKAGRIAGELAREGQSLNDAGDELIGATAVVHDKPVLTRNPDHFQRIDDVEVETY